MGRKTRTGISQERILEFCRERAKESGTRMFLGSAIDLLVDIRPDWDNLPNDVKDGLTKTFYDQVEHIVINDSDDEPFLDLLLGGLEEMDFPWLLYVESDVRVKKGREHSWCSHLREIRQKVETRKPRELYYLLLLFRQCAHSSIVFAVQLRMIAIAAAQAGNIKRYGDSKTATWTDRHKDFNTEKCPLLKDINISPENALKTLLHFVRTGTATISYIHTRPYRFHEEVLRNPPVQPIGRDGCLELIDRYLGRHDSQERRYYTIVGGPGTGKSTIMLSLLRRLSKRGNPCPCLLIARDKGHDEPLRLLEHLTIKLNPGSLIDLPSPFPDDVWDAERRFEKALSIYTGKTRSTHTVIFIDAIDETEQNPYGQPALAALLRRIEQRGGFPPGVRFVISARPTHHLRRLVGSYDIDLNTAEWQPQAIRAFYEDRLHTVLADRNGTITLDALVERTERSFLYAELAVREILSAYKKGVRCNVNRSPADLDEFLDIEWDNIVRGPLKDGKVSRIMSVVAAYPGTLSFDELHAVAGISLEEVFEFFAAHEHLFRIDRQDNQVFTAQTRVLGFWHLEMGRHFEENKLGPTALRHAHKAIAEWIQQGMRPTEVASEPARFERLVFHMVQAEQWHKCLDLTLSPDIVATLQQSPEGILALPSVLKQAAIAACMLRDIAMVYKAVAFRMRVAAIPSLPTCSLWMRKGNSVRSSYMFNHMDDGRQKLQDWMRISFLNNTQHWNNGSAFRPPVMFPAEGDARDIACLRAEVLAQAPPATWAHLTNTRMFEHPWTPKSTTMLMARYAEDLASTTDPALHAYLAQYISLVPDECITFHLVATLSQTNTPLCVDVLSGNASQSLNVITEALSEHIGAVIGLDNSITVARSFLEEYTDRERVRITVALFRRLDPPRMLQQRTLNVIEQVRLAACVTVKREKGEAGTHTLLSVLSDQRFHLYALEELCHSGFASEINWESELQGLLSCPSKEGRTHDGTIFTTFLSLLDCSASRGEREKRHMCLQVIERNMCDEWEWPGLLDAIALIIKKDPLELALQYPHRDRRWLRGCLMLLETHTHPEKAKTLLDAITATVDKRDSCTSSEFFDDTFFTKEHFNHILQHAELAVLAAVDTTSLFLRLRQLEQDAYLSAIGALMRFREPRRPVSSEALLRDVMKRYSHSLELRAMLIDIVPLFLLSEPVLLGTLLKRPESTYFDPCTVQLPMATPEERQASCEFLATCIHVLSCTDPRNAAREYAGNVFRFAFEGNADVFFEWCAALTLSANRFVPDEVDGNSYREAAHSCLRVIWNEAHRILAVYNPERAVKELRSVSSAQWPLSLLILHPLPWSRVWRVLAREEFSQAAAIWTHLCQHKPVEFSDRLDILLDMAWDILTDEAICDSGGCEDRRAKTLLAIASQCEDMKGMAVRPLMPLLEGLSVAAARVVPKALHSILPCVSDPFSTDTVKSIAASRALRAEEGGMSVFADFPETLNTADLSTAASLLTSYLRANRPSSLGSCIAAFFEILPRPDRDAILFEVVTSVANSLDSSALLDIAEQIEDGLAKMCAIVTIASKCEGLNQEDRVSMINGSISNCVLKELKSGDDLFDTLYTCVGVFRFLSGHTAERFFCTFFESIAASCNMTHLARLKTSAICALAKSDVELAIKIAEQESIYGAYPDILHRIEETDPKRACDIALRHIALLNGQGLRHITIEEDLRDSSEYLIWLIENPNKNALHALDRMLFESIRDIKASAGRDVKTAFLMAGQYSSYGVHFMRVISALKRIYLNSIAREHILWLAEDAPLSIVSELAPDVVDKFVEQYPREALALATRAEDPDLLTGYVQLKERWDYSVIDAVRSLAWTILKKHSCGDLSLGKRQIVNALEASLMDITQSVMYERLCWVVAQEIDCIAECLPIITEALLENTNSPDAEVNQILEAIGCCPTDVNAC